MKNTLAMRIGGALLTAYLVVFFIYLQSPFLIILFASFSDSPTIQFPPQGVSAHWYGEVLRLFSNAPGVKPGVGDAIWTSVWLGLLAMAGAMVAGVLAAIGLHRHSFPGKEALRQTLLIPLLFPQVVTGIGLLLWFSQIGGVPTWVRLLLGHVILTLPYVIVTVSASLETLDARIEEAAMNLGANRLATLWFITLPSIRPGLVSSAIFAWLTSFSNFTVTYFLYSGETTPLPPWLYEVIQHFFDPTIAALSAILVVLSLSVLFIVNRIAALSRLMGVRR